MAVRGGLLSGVLINILLKEQTTQKKKKTYPEARHSLKTEDPWLCHTLDSGVQFSL